MRYEPLSRPLSWSGNDSGFQASSWSEEIWWRKLDQELVSLGAHSVGDIDLTFFQIPKLENIAGLLKSDVTLSVVAIAEDSETPHSYLRAKAGPEVAHF